MTVLTALTRFVHLGSVTLLTGVFVFLLLVARPAFRKAEDTESEGFARFDQLLLRLMAWDLLIAVASALLWLAVQAATMSGRPVWQALSPEIVGSVLTRTQFGRVWQLRLALFVLLGGFLLLRERDQDARDWIALRFEGALLAGGLIAALAWAGHAAATEGTARLPHLVADVVHLLATGVWLGGLLPLALLLWLARRSLTPAWATVACEATRRFSVLGLVSVASLTLSGVVNSWVLVGNVAGLVGTPYGRFLLVKLSLLLFVIAIAAVNLLYLKPRLLALSPDSDASPKRFLRHLECNVLGEACLGAGILLIVGFLGIMPPGLHVQPRWPFSIRLTWAATKNLPGVWPALIVGSLGVLLGMLALGYSLRHRQHRLWVILLGFGLVGFYGADAMRHVTAVDAYPTTYLGSAVLYQTTSIANGLRLYQANCAVCHGTNGYGDGLAGHQLRPRPADLTAPHTGVHTAGDLFWWLSHGIRGSAMPAFEDRLSETDRWDLINFLRALSAAEQARSLAPLVEPTPWLVAPDFTFGIGVGPGETLREQRGKVVVHLVLFSLPGSLPRLEQLDAAWDTIAYAGTRVVAVPMRDVAQIYRKLGMRAVNFPVAVDGSSEIAATYSLFRRTFAAEGVPPNPDHMEFLIDRQGYIRALDPRREHGMEGDPATAPGDRAAQQRGTRSTGTGRTRPLGSGGQQAMRLYRVVILVNLALVFGFLAGSLWWAEQVDRLRRELAAARLAVKAQQDAEQRGTAQGIVRGVFPQKKLLYLTHEDIPGLMPSMTMGFRMEDPKVTRGLVPGDRVQFTVQKTGKDYVVIALQRKGSR